VHCLDASWSPDGSSIVYRTVISTSVSVYESIRVIARSALDRIPTGCACPMSSPLRVVAAGNFRRQHREPDATEIFDLDGESRDGSARVGWKRPASRAPVAKPFTIE